MSRHVCDSLPITVANPPSHDDQAQPRRDVCRALSAAMGRAAGGRCISTTRGRTAACGQGLHLCGDHHPASVHAVARAPHTRQMPLAGGRHPGQATPPPLGAAGDIDHRHHPPDGGAGHFHRAAVTGAVGATGHGACGDHGRERGPAHHVLLSNQWPLRPQCGFRAGSRLAPVPRAQCF